MKKRRILVLTHEDLVPPADADDMPEADLSKQQWLTDYNVINALHNLGHEVIVLGVISDLGKIKSAVNAHKPHVAFNLLEEFHGEALFDSHVVSYLELLRQPYTGCNPRGLILARDKALSKKVLSYHRVPAPKFAVFARGRQPRRPKKLEFPLLVKSLTEDGSLGISQASIVHNDEKMAERVAFIHKNVGSDAIAEQYIDGREMYVGVYGNTRLTTLPPWELMLDKLPDSAPRIATQKVKFDEKYQEKIGLRIGRADLPDALVTRLQTLAKRVYRSLGLSGYARTDWRVTDDGQVYLLEANPNPDLGYGQEFAESAEAVGMNYESMIQRPCSHSR